MAKRTQSEHRAPTPLELMLGSEGESSPMPPNLHAQRPMGWKIGTSRYKVQIVAYHGDLPYTWQAFKNYLDRVCFNEFSNSA